MSLLFNSENVGLITGDTKINPDANILICTTEVVRNMWYSGDARDPPIGLILDEFHYIAAKGRGTAVEEAVTLAPKGTSFLLLSATIEDERILGWLEKVKRNVVKVSGRERVVGLGENVFIETNEFYVEVYLRMIASLVASRMDVLVRNKSRQRLHRLRRWSRRSKRILHLLRLLPLLPLLPLRRFLQILPPPPLPQHHKPFFKKIQTEKTITASYWNDD